MASSRPKIFSLRSQLTVLFITALVFCTCLASKANGQTEEINDNSSDPIKLFEQGQNAHAHGDFDKALDFYRQALKLRPEFPEAEFQQANALVSLDRLAEAEVAFRRAIELRKNWDLPYSSLGVLLARTNRPRDAETILRQSLSLEPHNLQTLQTLADLRLRANDPKEAAELARRATLEKAPAVAAWVLLGMAQRALGEKNQAKESLDHALKDDPENVPALLERADLNIAEGNYETALVDLKTAERLKPADRMILMRQLDVYQRTGKTEDAERLARSLGLANTNITPVSGEIKVNGTAAEIEAANDADPVKARAALEILLQKNPRNAMLLAKLGASYRTEEPAKSLEFYRRANEIDPRNTDYAIGYSAALVQSRRFDEALKILHHVIVNSPDNYVAHANLATALYELKRFPEAIPEYRWLLSAKPDLAITYYFIATAHDKMGEFETALEAYELFLSHADPAMNELEIEKVKLRLPLLKKQIKLGQGRKRKDS